MALLEASGIGKDFGETHVLKDISLTLEQGEALAIIGSSGSGKTTLLRCLNFLERPDTGVIKVNGETMWDAADPATQRESEVRKKRLHFGLVFQNFNLFPQYTALQNVMLAGELLAKERPDYKARKKAIHAELEQQAKELLAQMGLSERAGHYPHQLSGGQQQRVAIARSLVSSDELIVLDEPITNLDAKLREEMILEIQMIQQNIGTTIIYITHDQEAALQLCDRISIMQPDGQICQIGSDEEIIRRPANRFVYSFIGVSNFLPVKEKGGKVCLALGSEPVLFDKLPQDYVSGKKNVMGVRPMDIVFDAKSPIRATIQRDTFLGNQYDYQVELLGKELRVERNALDVLADPTHYEAGQEVGLKFLNVKFYEEEANA